MSTGSYSSGEHVDSAAGEVGWMGKFPVFKASSPEELLLRLRGFVEDASPQQVTAWENSIPALQGEVGHVLDRRDEAKDYSALLEYIMPMEARRADAIFLLNGRVLVLEYKGYGRMDWADIDQANHYLTTLRNFHRTCHGRPVDAVLVLMGAKMAAVSDHSGVHICGPQEVHKLVLDLCSKSTGAVIDLKDFTSADSYQPLPSLMVTVRQLIKERSLRRVHRSAAKTDTALTIIERVAESTASAKRRSLILLSGAPGTGKTLVGIRVAVSERINRLALPRPGQANPQAAIFLSGNGPLVNVLKYEFKRHHADARAFIRSVRDYVEHYSRRDRVPPEHVLIFDEAQRAWDAHKVQEAHEDPTLKSEPEMFIQFSEKVPEWCAVLGLIGSGQEIHSGEEGGIGQWADAIRNSPRSEEWDIHGPERFRKAFESLGLGLRYHVHDDLHLDKSIRFHSAVDLHDWVAGLVDETKTDDQLRQIAFCCRANGLALRVTRSLDVAKRYLWGRYIKDQDARFGLVMSSRDKALAAEGVPQVSRFAPVGEWYADDEVNPNSCRRLREAITQFEAQGLELDAALVCWGSDFRWVNDAKLVADRDATSGQISNWDESLGKKWRKNTKIHNPLALRRNTYRVLLTRGRQGSVIFVPPRAEFDATYDKLVAAGCETLDRPVNF